MDPAIIKQAIKVVENAVKHKGTKLNEVDIEKLKIFGTSVKNKTVTLDECKEIFKICKTARIRNKQQ
jgi:hypothetical protein